jgi:Ribonuclease G/E
MELKPETPRLTQGQAVAVEVRAEGRGRKGPTLRFIDMAEGPPRLVAPGPDLAEQLRAFERHGEIIEGAEARKAADLAEQEALETVFPLPGGGDIAVEATRALTSVDVDIGARPGQESKRIARQSNLAALGVAARVLRLKGLAGLVVIDLVGRGHDGAALTAAARAAFAPDNPGVAIGPIGRFGTLELTIPRRRRPLLEQLLDDTGRPSADTVALRVLRAMEQEATASGGARITAAIAAELEPPVTGRLSALAARFGGRFMVVCEPNWPRERFMVSTS